VSLSKNGNIIAVVDGVVPTGDLQCAAALTNRDDQVRTVDPRETDARQHKAILAEVEARRVAAVASQQTGTVVDAMAIRPVLEKAVQLEMLWKRTLAENLWLFKAKHPHLLKPEKTAAWRSTVDELKEWWSRLDGVDDIGDSNDDAVMLATQLLDQTRGYSLSMGTEGAPALPAATELIAGCADMVNVKLPDGRTLIEAVGVIASDGDFIAEVPALLAADEGGAISTVPQAMLFACAKADPLSSAAGTSATTVDAVAVAEIALGLDPGTIDIHDGDSFTPLDHAVYSRNWAIADKIYAAGGTTAVAIVNTDEPARKHDLEGRLALAIHSCEDVAEFNLIMDLFGSRMLEAVIKDSRRHAATVSGAWHGQPVRPLVDRIAVIGEFFDLLLLGDAEKFSMRGTPWLAKLDRDDPRREQAVERYKTEIEAPLLEELDRIGEELLDEAEPRAEELSRWAQQRLDAHYRLYFAADCVMQDTDPDDAEYRRGAAQAAKGWTRKTKVLHEPAPTCLMELLVDADSSQAGYDSVVHELLGLAKLEHERYLRGPRKRPSRIICKLLLRRLKRTGHGASTRAKPTWPELFRAVRDVVRGQLIAKSAKEAIGIREAVAAMAKSKTRMDIVGYKDRAQRGAGTYGGWQDELLSWIVVDGSGPKHVNESQIVRFQLLLQRAEMGGHKTFGEVRGAVELLAALGRDFETRPVLDAAGLNTMIGELKAGFDSSLAEATELRRQGETDRREFQNKCQEAERKYREGEIERREEKNKRQQAEDQRLEEEAKRQQADKLRLEEEEKHRRTRDELQHQCDAFAQQAQELEELRQQLADKSSALLALKDRSPVPVPVLTDPSPSVPVPASSVLLREAVPAPLDMADASQSDTVAGTTTESFREDVLNSINDETQWDDDSFYGFSDVTTVRDGVFGLAKPLRKVTSKAKLEVDEYLGFGTDT
jgi:hypothetical protein